jgi:hypothetical protein
LPTMSRRRICRLFIVTAAAWSAVVVVVPASSSSTARYGHPEGRPTRATQDDPALTKYASASPHTASVFASTPLHRSLTPALASAGGSAYSPARTPPRPADPRPGCCTQHRR